MAFMNLIASGKAITLLGIIAAARKGERSVTRLRDLALAGLADTKKRL
jgi:hypothetical protein